MTKNEVKEAMITIKSLRDAIDTIEKSITDEKPELGAVLTKARMSSIEKAEKLLDDFNLEEGEPVIACELKIKPSLPYMELEMPLAENGKLVAYTGISDDDTRQVGIMHYTNDGSPIDLALAEVKKGSLAEVHGYDANNEDIDLMIWADPYTEDYTERIRIKQEDIRHALNDN